MKKVYIAARYPRMEEMAQVGDFLKSKGYEVTSGWVYGAETGQPRSYAAAMDLRDIDAADVVLSFTHPRGTFTPGGGRHVEFGYALAKGKELINIGPEENIFHCLPDVKSFETVEDWVDLDRG